MLIATQVALDNATKFGIVMIGTEPHVSTWHADDLVAAVLEAQGDKTDEIRTRRLLELHRHALILAIGSPIAIAIAFWLGYHWR